MHTVLNQGKPDRSPSQRKHTRLKSDRCPHRRNNLARAQCSRQTLARLESGSPEVSVGVLARVLNALQMPDELLLIAKNDEMGKVIQDIDLKNKKRVTGK